MLTNLPPPSPSPAMRLIPAYAVPPGHVFVFGLGYVGLRLARRLRAAGWLVSGTTFSVASAERASKHDIRAIHLHQNAPAAHAFLREQFKSTSHVVITTGPDQKGDRILRDYADVVTAASALAWIGYISSTTVYGDHQGAWIDETSPPKALTDIGERRLAAESEWSRLATSISVPLTILRLAGIYGPGRNTLRTLRDNPGIRSIRAIDQVLSFVHIDDIVSAITAAVTGSVHEGHLTVINLSDDQPAPRRETFKFATELLGQMGIDAHGKDRVGPERPMPGERSGRNAMHSSKRVSNSKMKSLLLPHLTYPTYREGLSSITGDDI